MAMTRREWLALAGLACAGCGHQLKGYSTYREITQAGRSRLGKLLVLMPDTPQTRDVWTGLSDELKEDLELIAVEVPSKESSGLIEAAVNRHAPSAVVVMNNPTLSAYRTFLNGRPANAKKLPAIVVMTSFLDRQNPAQLFATGIRYEPPLVTVVTSLRKIVAKSVDRVGVVRRRELAGFVKDQAEIAKAEGVRTEEEIVGSNPNPSEIKRALRLVRARSDALWVLNDDKLLTPSLIVDAWLPAVSERPWIPTIVGAASLVSPLQSFGTFAVLPDHTALGVQAAKMILSLADDGWVMEDVRVEYPVSTTTTIDLHQARERFALREGALGQVDRILQ